MVMEAKQLMRLLQLDQGQQRQMIGTIQQQQLQMQQQQEHRQQEAQQTQCAPQIAGNETQSQQLIRSWEAKTSGKTGREKPKRRTLWNAVGLTPEEPKMSGDCRFVDLNRERRIKAGKYVLCVLALYTRSETSTIVKNATGLDGMEAWASLHANHSIVGQMFRLQHDCMYPNPVKDGSREVDDHRVG